MSTGTQDSSDFFAPGNVVFGKYEIVRLIGDGGMGSVYEVIDQRLQKNLALKVLNSHVRDSQIAIRFQNEARNASRIIHPAIAQIYDFGVTDDGRPFMAVELANGLTLANYVKQNGCLQIGEFLCVFADLCGALKAAHNAGIVHRDLKPENIIVYQDDQKRLRAKLLDFGISRRVDLTDEEAQRLTRTGQIIGTPLFMSPEQANAQPVDYKSDYYSLGCVMFYSLAGQAPFRGDTAFDTLQMHCEEEIPELILTAKSDEVPEELEHLIHSLMSKDKEDRPSTTEEIDSVLRQLATAVDEELPPVEQEQITIAPEKSSYKWSKISIAALLILSIGIVALIWSRLFPNSQPTTAQSHSPEVSVFTQGLDTGKVRSVELAAVQTEINRHDGYFYLMSSELHDSDLAPVLKCRDIKTIKLDVSCNLTEDGILMFRNNPEVFEISVPFTAIESLKFVPKFPKMQALDVSDTSISDGHLAVFKNRPIKKLVIGRTYVTTRGIEVLKKFGFKDESIEISIKKNNEPKGLTYSDLLSLVRNGNRLVDTSNVCEQLRKDAFRLKVEGKLREADDTFSLIDELSNRSKPITRANAIYNRALIAGALKDEKKEAQLLQDAALHYTLGLKDVDSGLRLQSFERLAEIMLKQKRFAEAAALENEFVHKCDLKKLTDAQQVVTLEIQLGQQYRNQKQYERAIHCYQTAHEALQLHMNASTQIADAEIAGNLSWCLSSIGKDDDALPLYLTAITTLKDAQNPQEVPDYVLRNRHQIVVNSYIGVVDVLMRKRDLVQARRLNEEGMAYNAKVHNNLINQKQMEAQRAQIANMILERSIKP